MSERIQNIPLNKIQEYTTEYPWLIQIIDLIQKAGDPVEVALSHEGKRYHVFADPQWVSVRELSLPPDASLEPFRVFRQNMLARFKAHLEGLSHNLRGPISNVRSRSELMLQLLAMNPDTSSNPLLQKMERAFQRFLESSDQMNNQLTDMERLLKWMTTDAEREPISIRYILETLHTCFLTDLHYKRNIVSHIRTADKLPIWKRRPYLLVEPLFHMMNHAVQDVLHDQKGSLTWSVTHSEDQLNITLDIAPESVPLDHLPDVKWRPLQPEMNTGIHLALAHWITHRASGQFRVSESELLPRHLSIILPVTS